MQSTDTQADLTQAIHALVMGHFGLPTAGPYPGSAWQQLDPKYQRLADKIIALFQERHDG